jgi:hypothetical protein
MDAEANNAGIHLMGWIKGQRRATIGDSPFAGIVMPLPATSDWDKTRALRRLGPSVLHSIAIRTTFDGTHSSGNIPKIAIGEPTTLGLWESRTRYEGRRRMPQGHPAE